MVDEKGEGGTEGLEGLLDGIFDSPKDPVPETAVVPDKVLPEETQPQPVSNTGESSLDKADPGLSPAKASSRKLFAAILAAAFLIVGGLFYFSNDAVDSAKSITESDTADKNGVNKEPNVAVNEEKTGTGKVHDVERASTAQFPSVGQISVSSVNMRSGHSILAQRIATLPRGQNVTVLDSWVADSEQEAILKKDLHTEVAGKTKTLGKGQAVSLVQYDASQGKYLVSLQDKSGTISGWTSEENVKSLKGALWYKVSTPAGKTGWVLGEFVSFKK